MDVGLGPGRAVSVVPGPSVAMLSEKELVDYTGYREDFLEWLLHVGKNPDRAQGYSEYTVYETAYRSAAFDRWTWDEHGEYTVPPRPDDADGYLQKIAYEDTAQATKGKIEEMLHRYWRWLHREHGVDEWTPDYSFSSSGGNSGPRDFLTIEERELLWTRALRYQDDWKVTSLVWTSLDAGLRPVEVSRAKTHWVDVDNSLLRIPKEDAAKNENNWRVSLRDRTARALGRWLKERGDRSDYNETDALWLTERGNTYGSKSLKRLLETLCEQAGITTETRQLSWYAIRHSVGTYMTREAGLAAAQSQLRHLNSQTTMKYDQTPADDRRDALNRM